MRGQSALILGFIAALVIAVFAVINVDGVEVNYLFGSAEWPLILVILGSVVMGAVIVGSLGMIRVYRLQQELKLWKKRAGHSSGAQENIRGSGEENSDSMKKGAVSKPK
ncbi:lipopolysaccharide assembly LapA domain-containing protein [Alteribacillus sp. YIM 98480]|uniref:LapA family protein n=1 Tax=Alteribacillus sp. YIM 98480 TaxID=2606599 RepID=UPI00131B4160|nr:lipopolysaccharide assembly protein LapA domain-containing protein [Alteribacillus sp. YIM 98480]